MLRVVFLQSAKQNRTVERGHDWILKATCILESSGTKIRMSKSFLTKTLRISKEEIEHAFMCKGEVRLFCEDDKGGKRTSQ